MLLDLFSDPKVVGVLSGLLGTLLGYILSLRKLSIERKHAEADRLRDQKTAKHAQFLNDLNKAYADFTVSLDTAFAAYMSKQSHEAHAALDEGMRALTIIQQTAPPSLKQAALACWRVLNEMVAKDAGPPDMLRAAMTAHIADFHWLVKAHLHGDHDPKLPGVNSSVLRMNNAIDDFLKNPFGKERPPSIIEDLLAQAPADPSDPELQRFKSLLAPRNEP